MLEIRSALPDDLLVLSELERRADTIFEDLGIGPLPAPGTVEELADALVVLVAGDPPQGFARIDALGDDAHLEQLAVDPSVMRRGIGRALVRGACAWAREEGYRDLTLVTYRDVPWNGPFYASEGFAELGPADDWYESQGLEPEDPVLGRFGARVVMRRRLRPARAGNNQLGDH